MSTSGQVPGKKNQSWEWNIEDYDFFLSYHNSKNTLSGLHPIFRKALHQSQIYLNIGGPKSEEIISVIANIHCHSIV